MWLSCVDENNSDLCLFLSFEAQGAAGNFKLPHPSVGHEGMMREPSRMTATTSGQPHHMMMMPGSRQGLAKDDGIVTRSRSRMMRK